RARRRARAHRRRRPARPVGEGVRSPHRAPQRHRPRPHSLVHGLRRDLARFLEERLRRGLLPPPRRGGPRLLRSPRASPPGPLPFARLGAGIPTGGALRFPALQVALILSMRAVTTRVGRDPLWSIPLHPVAIAVWTGTLARSMVLAHTGREIEWKGRRYLTRPLEPEAERSRREASA